MKSDYTSFRTADRPVYCQRRFNNKSEVIRAGLRLLEEHEAKAATATREDLKRFIQSALADQRPLVPAADLLRQRSRR